MGRRWVPCVGLAVAVTLGGVTAASCGADSPDAAGPPGRADYRASCASCHGASLEGTSLGPSLLDPIYGPDQLSDDEFVDAVRNGVAEARFDFGSMPGNPGLSDAQIQGILDFVRAEQAAASSG